MTSTDSSRQTNGDQKKPSRQRRRSYIINATFQWRYTLTLATGVFLVASLMGISLFGILHQQARARLIDPSASNMWGNTMVIGTFALLFSVVAVTAMIAWGIVVTHRISGPIYVMQGYFEKLSKGEFPRRRSLRKRDEFKELFEQFWAAMDAIKRREKAQLAGLTEILGAAHATSDCGDAGSDALPASMVEQLQGMRDELAIAIGDGTEESPNVPKAATRHAEHRATMAAARR